MKSVKKLAKRIREETGGQGSVSIAFQGGEPLLAGLSFYRSFVVEMKKLRNIRFQYSLQTNGLLIDDDYAEFFRKEDFLVGISLDGPEAFHDRYRLDKSGNGTFSRVMESLRILKNHDVECNILTVVTGEISRHPKELFDFYRRNGLDYVQLIPCLPSLNKVSSETALSPESFSAFFRTFFDCWVEEYRKGHYMRVGFIENAAAALMGYPAVQCGDDGNCHIQRVIEANGDIYPCDFYCLDEYLLGNLHEIPICDTGKQQNALNFLKENTLPSLCKTCSYKTMCSGGCRRQRVCTMKEDFCARKELFDAMLPQLRAVVERKGD